MIDYKKEMQRKLELRHNRIVANEVVELIKKELNAIRKRNAKSIFKDFVQVEIEVGEYGVGDRPFGNGCEQRIREGKAARAYWFSVGKEHEYYYFDYHYVIEVLEDVKKQLESENKYEFSTRKFYPVLGNFDSYELLSLVQLKGR